MSSNECKMIKYSYPGKEAPEGMKLIAQPVICTKKNIFKSFYLECSKQEEPVAGTRLETNVLKRRMIMIQETKQGSWRRRLKQM